MASSPFFSGRIPPELYQRAVSHCEENGESKTDLLVKALSAYLDFPVTIPRRISTASIEVTKEIFDNLQERIGRLEELFKQNTNTVIRTDNTDNHEDNLQNTNDNILNFTDNKDDNIKHKMEDTYVITIDNNDNKVRQDNNDNVIKTDKSVDNKDSNTENKNVISSDNNTSQVSESQIPISEFPKFEEIFTTEVIKKTKFTRSQIDWMMSKAVEKAKQQGQTIEPGKPLEEPVEVFHKSGIKVNQQPYRLFYLGENFKEKATWKLIPDNENYQTVITEVDKSKKSRSNKRYQQDNNQETKEGILNLPVQEQAVESSGEQT